MKSLARAICQIWETSLFCHPNQSTPLHTYETGLISTPRSHLLGCIAQLKLNLLLLPPGTFISNKPVRPSHFDIPHRHFQAPGHVTCHLSSHIAPNLNCRTCSRQVRAQRSYLSQYQYHSYLSSPGLCRIGDPANSPILPKSRSFEVPLLRLTVCCNG